MNPVELVADIFKAYSNVAKTPLHIGEAMNLWTMLAATENFANDELVANNGVEDKDLKEKIHELIHNYHYPLIKELRDILLNEGVPLPESPTEKSAIKLNISPGLKMTDEDVANFVVFNLVWSINFCSRGLTESLRADIGTLFLKLIMQKSAFAITLKDLMAQKGWLKTPPMYKIRNDY